MSDEEKRWPFDGFYLKLAEAQREYEQEQHIDPASLTEEERQQKLQEILDCIKASRKKKKEADEQLDPIVPGKNRKPPGQLHSLQNSTLQILLVRITRTGMESWCLMRARTPARPILF